MGCRQHDQQWSRHHTLADIAGEKVITIHAMQCIIGGAWPIFDFRNNTSGQEGTQRHDGCNIVFYLPWPNDDDATYTSVDQEIAVWFAVEELARC